ncbi:MAG: DUF3791 domain-containing protein [Bacteroidaceae bacterium]|nr:DUF3791 domain-containing protein [Bacteroidaceae bacterium]
MGVYTDTYSYKEKALFLPWIVDGMAHRRGVSTRQAFEELRSCKALDYYDRCFGVLHTFSIDEAVDHMEEFCHNHKAEAI